MSTTPPPPQRGAAPPEEWTSGHLVVTGEAVALELPPANVVQRLLGGLVDLGIYAMFAVALMLGLSRLVENQAHLNIVSVVVLATMMVVLPTTVETLTRGLSAGKLAVGARVVRDDGGPIRFRHALVRSMLGVVEIWMTFGGLAVITAIISKRSKRLGDLLAGTYAIRVRGTEAATAPLLMPPDLIAWAATADIRRIPDHLAMQARMFLSRTGSVKDPMRATIGRQLAAAVEPFVSPPAPWGTNPERFLAAVLVARRDREYRAGLVAEQRDAAASATARRLPYGIPETG